MAHASGGPAVGLIEDRVADMSGRELRTLCLTCQGQGHLIIPRARLAGGGRIGVDNEAAECWFCKGDGWLRQATVRNPA